MNMIKLAFTIDSPTMVKGQSCRESDYMAVNSRIERRSIAKKNGHPSEAAVRCNDWLGGFDKMPVVE